MEFEYRVSDPTGRVLTGTITAETIEQAKGLLRSSQYLILELKPKRAKTTSILHHKISKINLELQYSFFRELAILLKSGITIDRALEILISSIMSVGFKKHLSNILLALKSGISPTEAFSRERVFPPLVISMLSAGENIGNLALAFNNIADYLRFQIQLRRDLQNTLAYPLFLILASLVTLLIIFKFILPRFLGLFSTASLPLSAQILLTISHLFTTKGLFILSTPLIILYLVNKFGYLDTIKPHIQQMWYRVPLVRGIIYQLDLTRFSYSMYSMLKAGLELTSALYLSKSVFSNPKGKTLIEKVISDLRAGKSFSDSLHETGLFPETFYHMVKVGEETSTLPEIFQELYSIYDEKFKSSVKRLLSLFEPIIITITGLVVGFIVISLILTIMSAGVIRI